MYFQSVGIAVDISEQAVALTMENAKRCVCVCVRACVRACVHVHMCVCMHVRALCMPHAGYDL